MNFFMMMAIPWRLTKSSENWEDLYRYRRIWRFSVTLTLVVSLMPLFVMIAVNYFLYQKNLKTATEYDVSRNVTDISRSLQFVIEERVAALEFLVLEKTRQELSDEGRMTQSFQDLKKSFGHFVDLGLINSHGDQEQYSGPYNLRDSNYSDQNWFHEVILRDMHVSDVFLGYRQFPHFVIAIKHEYDQQDFYILRATLDMDLLNRYISVPVSDRERDIFLISRDGVVQTSSRFYGEVLRESSIPVPPFSPHIEIVEGHDQQQGDYLLGYRYIENTPFILMVVEKRADVGSEWLRVYGALIAFLLISTIVIVLVVLWSYTILMKRLRAADLKHAQATHNAEYTNKMATIGRLSASVAHEINNPLAIINEKAGLLKDMAAATADFPHQDTTLAVAESIIASVKRCSAVTHRLLGFTRRMEGRSERIDLAQLLEEVLSFVGKEASHRNVQINTAFQPETPAIMCNRGQLQQIFLNIINNAIAAMRRGGTIELRLKPIDSEHVRVSVQDDGPGIPEADLQRVFEPYYSTKGEFGTGLGLSITYDLVKRLGGTISLRSKVKEGTCFDVVLPLKCSESLERA